MDLPEVVSRDEWRTARDALLAREQEAARVREAVSAERRRLPMVRVDAEYVFEGPDGKARLLDLFDGRRQLIVYHFMWLSRTGEGCPHCSFAADNVGHLAHLHARDTSFALVSRAPLAEIEAFRERMGWTLPWFSSAGGPFNDDFGATVDGGDLPGVSVFLRDGDEVFHTYGAGPVYGPGADVAMEPVLGTFTYLDLTPLGRQVSGMGWLRHHDRYAT
ncbi:MAG: DUF899 domain-containing protein [Actinoallomurus sp.]